MAFFVAVDHYENFPVASWLAPAPLRGAIVAIYGFARGADDVADEGDAAAATRLAQLDHYSGMLDAIERGEIPAEPPFFALAEAIRAHALPVAPFRALLSAFRQDVLKARYASFAELCDYCTRSANPIGRLLLHLYRVDSDAERAHSDAICTGLQLANFWQDVAVDWEKGRVYLPIEDLTRFGVTEKQIAAGECDERWQRLLAFEVARARELLESGRPLARALPLRSALELKGVIAGGLRILRAIDSAKGDVFRRRPTLSRRDWAAISVAALLS
jgi:squalene synthase HpnC